MVNNSLNMLLGFCSVFGIFLGILGDRERL
jgi:hypothetical protein